MEFSILAISDPNKLSKIEKDVDLFINSLSESPFIFSAFTRQAMRRSLSQGHTPLLLIVTVERKIIGLAQLTLRKSFGLRFAESMFGYAYSPDFIIDDRYREACIKVVLDFIFKKLKCECVSLYMPAESPNPKILGQKCKESKIHFRQKEPSYIAHRTIPVDCSWNDFQEKRGRNFKRRFKKIVQHLNKAGQWRIIRVDDGGNMQDVPERILAVERMSWKEELRTSKKVAADEDLLSLLAGSQSLAGEFPELRQVVWFLELNGQAIAYTLALQYRRIAFIAKTSYDNRYKMLYPGLFINNSAIEDFFNNTNVERIDLMTNLSFHNAWTVKSLSRVQLLMWRMIPLYAFELVFSGIGARTATNFLRNALLRRGKTSKSS